ncbi:MAG: GNAT family N-acetyltransferase, partial [Acutalibacteraceae bacterium]|nr:GNAT family N-acetyltransferase [Acutalibacteraceae bacterium]
MIIKVFDNLPKDALDLRIKVFVDEQGFVDEVDEFDSVSTHLVMYENEKPIATCRFYLKEDKATYMFGRLCVLKEYRGKSLGRKMLEKVEEIVKENGGKAIILHSQY